VVWICREKTCRFYSKKSISSRG